MIVGHARVAAQLRQALPPVTLLIGPESVGKMTMCVETATHHGAVGVDVWRSDSVRVGDAREIKRFLQTRPMGTLKAVLLRFDDVTPEASNALLAEMEEPPEHARFLLTSIYPPLFTVMSRAITYRCGLLSEEEIAQILVAQGMAQERAGWLAKRAGGTVQAALQVEGQDEAKSPVRSVLKSIKDANEELLNNALLNFEQKHLELLRRWVLEARTGRWVVFEEMDGYGLHWEPKIVAAMERRLRTYARPKIAAKAVALPIIESRKGG